MTVDGIILTVGALILTVAKSTIKTKGFEFDGCTKNFDGPKKSVGGDAFDLTKLFKAITLNEKKMLFILQFTLETGPLLV